MVSFHFRSALFAQIFYFLRRGERQKIIDVQYFQGSDLFNSFNCALYFLNWSLLLINYQPIKNIGW